MYTYELINIETSYQYQACFADRIITAVPVAIAIKSKQSPAMSVRLDDAKKIEQESKDIIYGNIRNIEKLFPSDIIYFTIPTVVIHCILLYYYIWEEIDVNDCPSVTQ